MEGVKEEKFALKKSLPFILRLPIFPLESRGEGEEGEKRPAVVKLYKGEGGEGEGPITKKGGERDVGMKATKASLSLVLCCNDAP